MTSLCPNNEQLQTIAKGAERVAQNAEKALAELAKQRDDALQQLEQVTRERDRLRVMLTTGRRASAARKNMDDAKRQRDYQSAARIWNTALSDFYKALDDYEKRNRRTLRR
jgi:uncharacterized Zn finger protein (UPF0148 family)